MPHCQLSLELGLDNVLRVAQVSYHKGMDSMVHEDLIGAAVPTTIQAVRSYKPAPAATLAARGYWGSHSVAGSTMYKEASARRKRRDNKASRASQIILRLISASDFSPRRIYFRPLPYSTLGRLQHGSYRSEKSPFSVDHRNSPRY
jgi:hypothetical protein